MNECINEVLDEAVLEFFNSIETSGLDSHQVLTFTATLFSTALLDIARNESDMRYIIHVCNQIKDNIVKQYLEMRKK